MMIVVISTCFGLSVVFAIWNVFFLFDNLPEEDRAWRDKPPSGFRMVWLWIKVVDHYCSRLYSPRRHEAANSKIVEAGLEFTLTSGQFIASRVVSAIAISSLCILCLILLNASFYLVLLVVTPWGYLYPDLWIRRVIAVRQRRIEKDLPFYLDIVTLSVESGTNLTGALTQAVQKAPTSPLRHDFNRVLRDIRSGKPRADALRELSDRAGNKSLSSVVSGLIQSERSGASLGPVLRSQASQLRSARFAMAEKKAMEAPVRLLAPLVIFIFPTTFIVLGFLILSKMLLQNMINWTPIVWAYSWPG